MADLIQVGSFVVGAVGVTAALLQAWRSSRIETLVKRYLESHEQVAKKYDEEVAALRDEVKRLAASQHINADLKRAELALNERRLEQEKGRDMLKGLGWLIRNVEFE